MLALEDYYYNGPEKVLGFSPKINAQHFTGFFTAADAWGNISQQLTRKQQTNTVQVAYGIVNLCQLQVTPLQPKPLSVSPTSNGKAITSHFTTSDTGKLRVCFDEVKLTQGAKLAVTIGY